ncbi:MAG: DUF2007 domain-containing protein [Gammaproteobacteria bacterium]
METIYSCDNTVEAHMIIHLLERHGIESQILGEHLQGAVGELPAFGNVRVAVALDDVSEAKRIIGEWEAQRADADKESAVTPRKGSSSAILAFVMGAVIASGAMLWALNRPVDFNAADYNGDDAADEWTEWNGNYALKTMVDRNYDSDVDAIYHYSRKGGTKKSELDNDFDGTFEEKTTYLYAQPLTATIDMDGDKRADRRVKYANGVLQTIELIDSKSGNVRKIQSFDKGHSMIDARWDSDGDGILDTLIRYGPFEEELSRSSITAD